MGGRDAAPHLELPVPNWVSVSGANLPGTAAAASPAPAASTSAPLTTGAGAGTRFVDIQGATLEFLTVQRADGRLGLGLGGHLHESETLGLAAELVHDHVGRRDFTESLESLPEFLVRDLVRQIADVDPHEPLLHEMPYIELRVYLSEPRIAGTRTAQI